MLPQPPSDPALYHSRPDLSNPRISIKTTGGRVSAGSLFLTPAARGTFIFDDSGSPLWIRSDPAKVSIDFRMATYRGSPVLTWWEGSTQNGYGTGEYVIVDQAYAEIARVSAGNGLQGDLHEFVITADGTALLTAYEVLANSPSPGGMGLIDSIVQEVDIASGRVIFQWRASDHVDLDESYLPPPLDKPFDYFHINSIDVDADGNLLISSRHTWAIYKIDRKTGSVIWRLGGKRSDFAMGLGAQFAWQHDARRQPDRSISLFDDGSNAGIPTTENLSRGIVLDLDEAARTATLRKAYSRSGILASSQGSMQILPNGNVMIGWGSDPHFTEFAVDGSIVLEGSLTSGSYRAYRYDWHGHPTQPPAVKSVPNGSGTVVFASWNGATDVATWVALGGASADSLRPLASHERTGFETAIAVPGRPQLIAAQALDAAGAVLAVSPPTKTT